MREGGAQQADHEEVLGVFSFEMMMTRHWLVSIKGRDAIQACELVGSGVSNSEEVEGVNERGSCRSWMEKQRLKV